MAGGIVRIVRRLRRLGIMSFIIPTITAAMPDGLPLARQQSVRLSADSSERRHTNQKGVKHEQARSIPDGWNGRGRRGDLPR